MSIKLTKLIEVYNFIYDELQIRQFAELIGLQDSIHQIFVAARSKYNKNVQFKTAHVANYSFFDVSIDKFINFIKKCEVSVGIYGSNLPTDCFAVYCTTNARKGKIAAKNFITNCLDSMFSGDEKIFNNMHEKLTGTIMASKEKTVFTTIDIDSKEDYKKVKDYLKSKEIKPAAIVETRGGYHVLIKTDENLGDIYKTFSSIHTMGDTFCPIPGTLQGGFPVKFVPFD